MHKACTKCRIVKMLKDFPKSLRTLDGCGSWCKFCKNAYVKSWVEQNKSRKKNCDREYYKVHRAKFIERAALWKANNKEKVLECNRKYKKLHSREHLAGCRRYKAAKKGAVPPWLTIEQWLQIKTFYINCPKGFHVDHIVPLQGENVSGLHVPWNLQLLPAVENYRKNNKFDPTKIRRIG